MNSIKLYICVLTMVSFLSCKKEVVEPVYQEDNLAPLSVEFDNIMGGQNLILNTGNYKTSAVQNYNIH